MTKSESISSIISKFPKLSNALISKMVGCSKRHVRRVRREKYGDSTKQLAKILLFDIETSPIERYCWDLKPSGYVSPTMIIKNSSILCWSAKYLCSDKMYSDIVSPDEAINRECGSILKGIWDLIDEADILVAHYGSAFDIKWLNAQFAIHGFSPPSPYRFIDTKKEASKTFWLSSYKLDYINQMFKLKQKTPTSFKLWIDCVHGDETALKKMLKYNINDTQALEELYLVLRPWIKSHPAMGLYVETDGEICPTCGNENLDWKGYYYTPAGRYRSFRCVGCGSVGRSRYSDMTKEEKENLVISVAR